MKREADARSPFQEALHLVDLHVVVALCDRRAHAHLLALPLHLAPLPLALLLPLHLCVLLATVVHHATHGGGGLGVYLDEVRPRLRRFRKRRAQLQHLVPSVAHQPHFCRLDRPPHPRFLGCGSGGSRRRFLLPLLPVVPDCEAPRRPPTPRPGPRDPHPQRPCPPPQQRQPQRRHG